MSRPDWFPDWSGQDCVIVASGPSAVDQPLDLVRGRSKVIVINHSWRLAPWADVLYASDFGWWRSGFGNSFVGLKVSRSVVPGVHKVDLVPLPKTGEWVNDMVLGRPGVIGTGGSSGFQALNLAVQFGSRSIALVGFDARVDGGTHWHGDHVRGLNNPTEATAAMWALHLDRAALRLSAAGVDVVNCSSTSALTAYPKTGLGRWLKRETP